MPLVVLLAPSVQHVGIHAVTQRQRSDGGSGLHASGHQLGLELRGVGAMRTAHGVARGLRVFEHRVHGKLRAHDLAQAATQVQDGLAGRIRMPTTDGVVAGLEGLSVLIGLPFAIRNQ